MTLEDLARELVTRQARVDSIRALGAAAELADAKDAVEETIDEIAALLRAWDRR